MATQKIFQSEVRSELGTCKLEIFDTSPDSDTPNGALRGDVIGGIKLQQGDTGQSGEGLPFGVFGSYFDLQVTDPTKALDTLFSKDFSRSRFPVELTFPPSSALSTFYGAVEPSIQTRPIAPRLQVETISVTVSDGLGALKDAARIPSGGRRFGKTIIGFLMEGLSEANPDLDLYYFSDVRGNRPTTGRAPLDLEFLVPSTKGHGKHAPVSGENKRVEGSSAYDQLENLCKKLHAALFQDLRKEAWVFCDAASIGFPVDGKRVDVSDRQGRTRVRTYIDDVTFNGQTETLKEPRVGDEDRLEPIEAAGSAVLKNGDFSLDPNFEQLTELPPTNSGLLFWDQGGATLEFYGSAGNIEGTEVEIKAAQAIVSVPIPVGVSLGDLDAVRVQTTAQGGSPKAKVQVVYRDGPNTFFVEQSPSGGTPLIFDLDGTRNSVENVTVFFTTDAVGDPTDLRSYTLDFLQTDQEVQPDGTRKERYRSVDQIIFDEQGRGSVQKEVNGTTFLTTLSNGYPTPSAKYISRRYSDTDLLARWQARDLLNLLNPGIDTLRDVALGQWLPLGTRVKWEKPIRGDGQSDFVHQTGRTLHIGTEDFSAATEINEVEIDPDVSDTVSNVAVESVNAALELTGSVNETAKDVGPFVTERAGAALELTASVNDNASPLWEDRDDLEYTKGTGGGTKTGNAPTWESRDNLEHTK